MTLSGFAPRFRVRVALAFLWEVVRMYTQQRMQDPDRKPFFWMKQKWTIEIGEASAEKTSGGCTNKTPTETNHSKTGDEKEGAQVLRRSLEAGSHDE